MAVIMAHAGGADAAERHVVLGHVQQGIVDAHATGVGLVHQALLFGLVVAEVVERQRAGALGNVVERRIQIVVRQNWQQRAEDLVLHDLHIVGHVQ